MKLCALFLVFILVIPIESRCMSSSFNTENYIIASHDSAPQAKETEGVKKKKHVVGKIVLWTLHLAVIGGAVWYFFINPDSPIKKKEVTPTPQPLEKGDYTSVTVRISLKAKGYNVGVVDYGLIYCMVDRTVVEELSVRSFRVNDLPGPGFNCDNAILISDKSKDIVFTKSDFLVKFGFNAFILDSQYDYLSCLEFSIVPIAYSYEPGKADPGMPNLLGVDKLKIDTSVVNGYKYKYVNNNTQDNLYIYIIKPNVL